MNKIIERLASEANIFEGELEGLGGSYGGNKKEVKRFAKLIIKDCAEEIHNSSIIGNVQEDWDKGYNAGLTQAISIIKERFDVK